MRALATIFVVALGVRFALFAAPPTSYDQALANYNKTDYAASLAILRTIPETAQSLELMGRCFLMGAEFKKATEVLEKAVGKSPNSSMTWTWLARAYGRRAETAFALSALGLANKTREAFERAVQLDPGNNEALSDLFQYYVEAPGVVGGGHDKARKLLPQIAKNNPAEGAFASARLAEAGKEHHKAEEHLREAIARAPQEVGHILDLAAFLARRGRHEESDRTFLQAEKTAPEAPKVLYARAAALINAKRDLITARSLLNKYLATKNLTPDDPSRAEAQMLIRKAQGS